MACYSVSLKKNRIITRFFRGRVQFLHFFPNHFCHEITIFTAYLVVGTDSNYVKILKGFTEIICKVEGEYLEEDRYQVGKKYSNEKQKISRFLNVSFFRWNIFCQLGICLLRDIHLQLC